VSSVAPDPATSATIGRLGDRSTALVAADGEVGDRATIDASWPGWADHIGLVVAADGGAAGARHLGFAVDLLVGDGDSIEPSELARLVDAGVAIRRAARDKDESDTELAVAAAVELGAAAVVIVGALGGRRFDHALANVGLLAHPALGGRPCCLLSPHSRIRLLTGPARLDLPGRLGDVVSLLPFGDAVAGVTTSGLAYPLADEPLPAGPARGLSNVRQAAIAAVEIREGRLLVVETPATLGA